MTPMDLDGVSTRETVDRLATDGENEIVVEATTDGRDAQASVEVSHSTPRWSVAGVVEWARRRGFGAGAKGRIRLGD